MRVKCDMLVFENGANEERNSGCDKPKEVRNVGADESNLWPGFIPEITPSWPSELVRALGHFQTGCVFCRPRRHRNQYNKNSVR